MKPQAKEFTDIPRPPAGSEQQKEFFNLSLLLKRNDLNMRRAAESDIAISVGEYFDMLSRFVDLAPDVSDALEQFANNDFNDCKKANTRLNDMIELLEEMQCDKFIVDFRFLNAACLKISDWSHAATHAEQIRDGFAGVYKRVETAKALPLQNAPHSSMPLEDYIDLLDRDDSNRKLSIMAVDDSVDILRAIFLVLRDDYKVYPVPDPTQVEEMLTHIKPDLFLLDYSMPQLSGLELIPVIREFPEHKDTPVIFLTAVGNIDRKSAAVMLGACDFLDKPIPAELLREKIAEHI